MRIVVTGSREWTDIAAIERRLREIDFDPAGMDDQVPTLIHGGARGADRMAGEVAHRLGFWVGERPADWEQHGKAAGFIRNVEMLEEEPVDLVLAFQVNGSRGTQHTIDEARKRGIAVEVITG